MSEDSTHHYYETHALEYFCATCNIDLNPLWKKLEILLRPGSLILDLGCGSGRDLLHFSRRGFRAIGIDYSQNLLQLASAFSEQPVVLGNINALPFRSHTFDAVWSIGSLLHVPRLSLPAVLSNINRVLKPRSVLLSSVKKGHGEIIEPHGRYTVFYQDTEWERLLLENNYEVVELYESLETRESEAEGRREINWIVSIARTP